MAVPISVIGRSTRVRGRVSGTVDIEVQGLVDGEIVVEGDVTVDANGLVGSGIRGRRLVVRGAVRGDLVAEESVLLGEGARVLGDVRAPRVSMAAGALVRGYVETQGPGGVSTRAAREGEPALRPGAPVARPASSAIARGGAAGSMARAGAGAPPGAAMPPTGPTAAARPPGPPPAGAGSIPTVAHEAHDAHGTARRPPPPVVPALKKAKGQMARRKER